MKNIYYKKPRLSKPKPPLSPLKYNAKVIDLGERLINLANSVEMIIKLPLETSLQSPLSISQENQPLSSDEIKDKVYYLKSPHPLIDFLWHYRQIDVEDIIYSFSIHTLPPSCHLILKSAPATNLRKALDEAFTCINEQFVYVLSDPIRRILIDFIVQIHQEKTNDWFNVIKKAYYRAEYDNFKSYTAYLKALFKKYARLLVIRVDLGYYQSAQIYYEQFINDVDIFLKKVSFHRIFQDKVGYIWKLEYGTQKGFHMHLLLFFDGAKRKADYYIAKQIGELWQAMDPNRCLYFNCHAQQHKASYAINCLGAVTRHDDKVIEHLQNKVIKYFTKTDAYIKLFNQHTHKLSDRGQLPTAKKYGFLKEKYL